MVGPETKLQARPQMCELVASSSHGRCQALQAESSGVHAIYGALSVRCTLFKPMAPSKTDADQGACQEARQKRAGRTTT